MRVLPHLFVIGSILLFAIPAPAFDFTFPWTEQEASLEITETLVGDYHDDNFDGSDTNDKYGDIRNRLNLKLAVEKFTFSIRIDTASFINAPDATPPYLHRYAPEKMTASYRWKDVQLTLGDHYGSFGRGMALRIRKTSELAEDTTLMGGKVNLQLGPVEISGMAGLVNPSNTDGVTEKTISDYFALQTDVVSGLRAEWRILDNLLWGIHGVGVFFDPAEKNNEARGLIETSILPRRAFVAGTSVEVPDLLDWADLYVEFDWLQRSMKNPDFSKTDGWAFFFGSNVYLGNWTLTTELKSYDDYELYSITDGGDYAPTRIDYIRPPTLEPEDMEVDNNRSVTGARLQVDWRPGGAETLLFASYAGFLAEDTLSSGERWWIYNMRLGGEQEFLQRGLAKVDVGLREEVPLEGGAHSRQLIYLNASAKIPLASRHSLELHGTNWWGHQLVFALDQSKDYLKGEWSLGYSWSPYLSVSAIVGYDTELSGSRDLSVFFEPGGGQVVRQVFLAGSLTLNFSSMFVVKLLGGQLRGGPKCVNGACRIFPPFSGVRLEVTFRI